MFKLGDRVRILSNKHGGRFPTGTIGTITDTNGSSVNLRVDAMADYWWYGGDGDIELVNENGKEVKPLRFLLKYDRDVDPIEFFATEAEVKARIGKLLGDSGVQRGSFRVFELKRELSVEISCTEGILPTPFKKYAVSLKGTGRGRPRKRKRGRPRKDS